MNTMQFEYEVYFRQNTAVPLSVLLFAVFMIVGVVVNLIMSLIKRKPFRNYNMNDILGTLAGFGVILLMLSTAIIPLARGGFYLLQEKEGDAVVIKGVIEETFEHPSFGGCKYGVEQNRGKGEGIIVDGIKYNLVTYGDFKVGDEVEILVLPKSKFILEIKSVDPPESS